jgi:hypothetical protein
MAQMALEKNENIGEIKKIAKMAQGKGQNQIYY